MPAGTHAAGQDARSSPGRMIMVAYGFFRKEDAIIRFEVLKEDAGRQAEQAGLGEHDWWWNYRGDEIVFAFAKMERGRAAGNIFVFNSKLPCRADWSES